jgi:hypothetical protein
MKVRTFLGILSCTLSMFLIAERIDENGLVFNPITTTYTSEELTFEPFSESSAIMPVENVVYKEVWLGSVPDEVVMVPVDEYDDYIKTHGGSPTPLPPRKGCEYPPPPILPLWGDDVLIDYVYHSLGEKLSSPSIAVADNNDIYAACEYQFDTKRGIRVYRSTDKGTTWAVWGELYSTTSNRRRPTIIINESGSPEQIILSYDIELSSTEFNVWTVRSLLPTWSGWEFSPINNTAGTLDTGVVITKDHYNNYNVYAAFTRNWNWGNSIYFSRSIDQGYHWEQDYYLALTNLGRFCDPRIAAGYNGNVLLAYWFESNDPRFDNAIMTQIAKFRASNPTYWKLIGCTSLYDGIDDREPDIAMSAANEIQVCFLRNNKDIWECYSTDTGKTWNCELFAYGGDDKRTRWPRLCVNQSTGVMYLIWRCTCNHPPLPERIAATYSDTPGTWERSTVISDLGNEPSFLYPASLTAHWTHNPADMPWVVWFKYLLFTTYGFYFDHGGNRNRSVEEKNSEQMSCMASFAPNPWTDRAWLSYTVKQAGHVTISLFDATGRLVENVKNDFQQPGNHTLSINNSNLATGIYFLQIDTPDGSKRISTTFVR